MATGTIRLNAALREIRERTGVSIAAAAAETGGVVSEDYWRKLENGRRSTVSPEVYAAIRRVLRIRDYRTLLADPGDAESAPDSPNAPAGGPPGPGKAPAPVDATCAHTPGVAPEAGATNAHADTQRRAAS